HGDEALCLHRLAGRELHGEPDIVAGGALPERRELGRCVARDHGCGGAFEGRALASRTRASPIARPPSRSSEKPQATPSAPTRIPFASPSGTTLISRAWPRRTRSASASFEGVFSVSTRTLS